jgi:hypothetical protein
MILASVDEGGLWRKHLMDNNKGLEALKYLTDRRAVSWYLIERPEIFIPKKREMMTSWLVCGYVASCRAFGSGAFERGDREGASKIPARLCGGVILTR